MTDGLHFIKEQSLAQVTDNTIANYLTPSTTIQLIVAESNAPTAQDAPKYWSGEISSLIGLYQETGNKTVASKKDKLEISNKLIAAICAFISCGGLVQTNCKNWPTYVDRYFVDLKHSKSSIYHFGEVAGFARDHGIKPSDENNPGLRAICRVKQTYRSEVWGACIGEVTGIVPTAKEIKVAYNKRCNPSPIDSALKKLQSASFDKSDIHDVEIHIEIRRKELELDQYGVARLTEAELDIFSQQLDEMRNNNLNLFCNSESESAEFI
jgi:hypothetical protein